MPGTSDTVFRARRTATERVSGLLVDSAGLLGVDFALLMLLSEPPWKEAREFAKALRIAAEGFGISQARISTAASKVRAGGS